MSAFHRRLGVNLSIIVISLFVTFPSLAMCQRFLSSSDSGWPPKTQIDTLPFQPVDKSIAWHEVENRGFLSVPLDWASPSTGQNIDIFYRHIPRQGVRENLEDMSIPTIVVIHGGPAIISNLYRSYDFDYKSEKKDVLTGLLNNYNILILDQRGSYEEITPGKFGGNSAPLDFTQTKNFVDPNIVVRLFGAEAIAMDHVAVINHVLGGRKFFVLGQSYGGIILNFYLKKNRTNIKPLGVLFTSAVLPGMDKLSLLEGRRQGQKELNLELAEKIPGLIDKVESLRRHFKTNGINPAYVNFLIQKFIVGNTASFDSFEVDHINRLLNYSKQELLVYIKEESFGVQHLNYILSAAYLTEGYTDRQLYDYLKIKIPFENWMFDLSLAISTFSPEFIQNTEYFDYIDHTGISYRPDSSPPNEVSENLAEADIPSLFIYGRKDNFMPSESAESFIRTNITSNQVSPRELVILDGAHSVAFLGTGVETIENWINHLEHKNSVKADLNR